MNSFKPIGLRAAIAMLSVIVLLIANQNCSVPVSPMENPLNGAENAASLSEESGFLTGANASTNGSLFGKVVVGYQGWFTHPGDGSGRNYSFHWTNREKVPGPNIMTVDFWPDLSEFDADELFPTNLLMANGTQAKIFSSVNPKTTDRHVRWMKEYNIDGAFLQRFLAEVQTPEARLLSDKVIENFIFSAARHGRTFAIMYDLSGYNSPDIAEAVKRDWNYLVTKYGLTTLPTYMRHRDRPVLGVWGIGFSGRSFTPQQATTMLDWLKVGAPATERVSVLGGVPFFWRSLTGDASNDSRWVNVYRKLDVVSPWYIGRFTNESQVAGIYRDHGKRDFDYAKTHGMDYMPTAFPGFSWQNLVRTMGGNVGANPYNQIPRNGGKFLWAQLREAARLGSGMVYGAMFDEIDEGTALFKLAPTKAHAPVNETFVTLDADGYKLPSDWYLQIMREGRGMVAGTRSISESIDISPTAASLPTATPAPTPSPTPSSTPKPTPAATPPPASTPSSTPQPSSTPSAQAGNEKFVSTLYSGLLGRAADPSGFAFYIKEVKTFGCTHVTNAFLSSDEYAKKTASRTNGDFVTALYQGLLGRSPDNSGYGFYLDRLNKSLATRKTVESEIKSSGEFKTRCQAFGLPL